MSGSQNRLSIKVRLWSLNVAKTGDEFSVTAVWLGAYQKAGVIRTKKREKWNMQ